MRVNLIPTVLISAVIGAAAALALANVRPFLSPAAPPAVAPVVNAAPIAKAPAAPSAPVAAAAVPENRAGPAAAAPVGGDHADPWPVVLAGKWPLALLLALLMIAFSSRLRRIVGAGSKLVRKVSAGGVEMEISSEAVDQVRQQLKGSFRELVANAQDEYERMSDLQEVDTHLQEVLEASIFKPFRNVTGLRATVHVPDIIFEGYLYQLLDYYPRGAGAHRRFSHRYGIIGQSWRSGKSHGTGAAFAQARSEEDLVEHWGMTRREARGKLKEKPSCLSVLLRFEGLPVGILYVDSDEDDAFGVNADARKLVARLENDDRVKSLAGAVARTMVPLRAAAPNLNIGKLG